MTDNSTSSYFVCPDTLDISSQFTEITEIPTKGFALLMRAKRAGQWWVLKGLKAEHRGDFVYQELLQKEFDILSRMHSPLVVSASEMTDLGGYGKCIVMEWVDGTTLGQWLRAGHSRKERRRIFGQLLDAVEYVHHKQIVHRDLKPGNIMITRNGQNLKLIDFGLADTDNYTVFKQPAGTDGFIAPEQSSTSVPDIRNDIYSIGCLMRQMHIGRVYSGVMHKCLLPIGSRYANIAALRNNMRRIRRGIITVCVLLAVLLMSGSAAYVYHKYYMPTFNVVDSFIYDGKFKCESWGGGLATLKCSEYNDSTIEIPLHVYNNGNTYTVSEITFQAFLADKNLRSVTIPPSDSMHIMMNAFSLCPNLRDIYFRSPIPCQIGNAMWKTTIDKVFDKRHFSTVTLHVPQGSLQRYRRSEWNAFEKIEEYK